MCTYTHFYRGRTYPCPTLDCPLDHADYNARFYSYTPVKFRGALRLLELTQGATWQISQQVNGGLAGHELHIWRQGKRQNSPLMAKITDRPKENGKPHDLPDIRKVLLKIWCMPLDDPDLTDDLVARHVRAALKRLMRD